MIKLENGANGSFKVNNLPYQKGLYEPVFKGEQFGIRRLGTQGQASDYLISPAPATEWVDNTDTPFADVASIATYLETFFFRETATALTPDDQQVNTFADLPDPSLHADEVWFVKTQTGVWILGTRRQSGFYISDGVSWIKTNDPLQYLIDDQLTIKDDVDNSKQVGFELSGISPATRRVFNYPDKDGTFAMDADKADKSITVTGQNSVDGGGDLTANRIFQLVNDELAPLEKVYAYRGQKGFFFISEIVSNNAGQIKLNWTDITRPTSGAGFTSGVIKQIPLNNNYTVSGSPTTTYPFFADDIIGGENVIEPSTLFLRELIAGQTIAFRLKVGYINKNNGQNGKIEVALYNPNPASSFRQAKTLPAPDGTNEVAEEFEFFAIADGFSLNPLYGYALECESSFNDGNLEVYIQEITAFYQAIDIFNKN